MGAHNSADADCPGQSEPWSGVERTAVREVAPLSALIFGAHYGILVFVHGARQPFAVTALAAATAVIYLALALRWRFVKPPTRSSPVVITLAGLALVNNAHLFLQSPSPEHSSGHFLVLAGVALLDVTWPAFWGFLVCALAAFSIGPILGGFGPEWHNPSLLMAGTVTMSLSIRTYRVRSRSLLEEARTESERQRHAAEAGVVALRHETAERERLQEELARSAHHKSLAILAGGVAHDVNNLMTVVMGNAHLVLDHPISAALKQEIDAILEAGERATLLSKSLLAYAGGEKRALVPVDLSVESATIANLAGQALPPGVEIELSRPPDPLPVLADRSQLQQVMSNLIINAADATLPEGGTIHVTIDRARLDAREAGRLEPAEPRPGGEYAQVEVRDQGRGMTPEIQARIFDPFFTTKAEGSGLGLAAVLGIARTHGGGLRVESQPGGGSSLTFLIPVSELPGEVPIPPSQVASRLDGPLLIVDDRDDVLATVERGLRAKDVDVETANSGDAALEVLEQAAEPFVAAVVDMSMPTMDGEATLHALRRIEPDLPILLTSGYDAHAAAERLTSLPRVGFLAKPYRIRDLLVSVEALRQSTDRN